MRAILVGIKTKEKNEKELKNSLSELEGLVEAAEGKTLGKIYQKRDFPDPATFIGKGKVKQLKELAEGIEADTIVFDAELTPVQISNIEKITEVEVLDRTDLILQIFSRRAKTRQAKLQVELAMLEHELPRIYGQKGKALSRIGGGMKTKGAGEKLGEIKVRTIKDRIAKIKKQRYQQRKWRNKDPNLLKVSLVGYTNVGKSTLLKRLTKRDTFISDQLFATLDTKTSFINFPDIGKKAVITDTVGFVKNMPKEIMDAFMATLEELEETDLILHVVDISDENWQEKVESVDKILRKIKVHEKPQILVFNKIDKVIPSQEYLEDSDATLLSGDRESVIVSTKEGWNIDKLYDLLKKHALQKQAI